MKERLSSVKIAKYLEESCCYRILQIVEFYLIYNQDIDDQTNPFLQKLLIPWV